MEVGFARWHWWRFGSGHEALLLSVRSGLSLVLPCLYYALLNGFLYYSMVMKIFYPLWGFYPKGVSSYLSCSCNAGGLARKNARASDDRAGCHADCGVPVAPLIILLKAFFSTRLSINGLKIDCGGTSRPSTAPRTLVTTGSATTQC